MNVGNKIISKINLYKLFPSNMLYEEILSKVLPDKTSIDDDCNHYLNIYNKYKDSEYLIMAIYFI